MPLKLGGEIDERPAQIVEFATDAIISKDRAGMITSWNLGAGRLYGYRAEEVVGRPITLLIPDEQKGEEWDLLLRVLGGERIEYYETLRRTKDGSIVNVSLTLFALRDGDGEVVGAASIAHDITRRLTAERARRDLEGRHESFLEGVSSSMNEGMLTLDAHGRIATVNSAALAALGYAGADLIGATLCEAFGCGRGELLGHPIAGCGLDRVAQSTAPLRLEEELLLCADATELPVSLSAAPLGGDSAGTAGHIVVFHDVSERRAAAELAQRELEEMSWVGRLTDAMDEDRLVVAVQPIVSLSSSEVVSLEMLVRVRGRDGALVPPGKFLPAAERYGQIGELDRWMIIRAARLAAAGQNVNVNLSAQSLGDPQLQRHVERSLSDAGADPRMVTFEITETALTEHLSLASEFAAHMAELGCEFALDDFGTGYGAFTYLKTLPIKYLKIDIEFVHDLLQSKASEHLISATVQLARGFGQLTVAEGVEDEATLERLRELDVDFVQGFFIGRPEVVAEERLDRVPDPGHASRSVA